MPKKTEKSLVIVESPAKARTIANILGKQFEVKASIGHVRDLPKVELGVDTDHGFEPRYVIPRGKRRVVKEIAAAAERADTIYLATDPDREGEAIAWHLLQAAGLEQLPHKRVVFHEVTPAAVQMAFRDPRDIDMRLVEAQQARRVLDRLVGYRLSPFLWRKIKRGLSAGRVQSVALRLEVEREEAIRRFVSREYWSIEAELTKGADGEGGFRAKLVGYVGKKRSLEIADEAEAQRLIAILQTARYRVAEIQKKEQHRRPAPPFITSTLQQDASRRLGFSAQKTMVIAQQLYEGLPLGSEGAVGLITYMRTDSVQVAESARREVRDFIAEKYGQKHLPSSPREYRKKVKGAQEAHEAIRPASIRRDPKPLRSYLNNDQHRLYSLIWQRMLASQMADAVFDITSADIEAHPATMGEKLLLRTSSSRLRFPGYQELYRETTDEAQEEDGPKSPLPEMSSGDLLGLLGLFPEQHSTEPPARYTEASLVRALEENGIGRPSTYAPILATIQERGYVERDGRQLRPTDLGFVVNEFLVEHFSDFVDVGFTAEMEEELDEIARGEREWRPVVQAFYQPLERALAMANEAPPATQVTEEKCDQCGEPMIIRWGRHGRFLACSGFPKCRNSRPLEGEEEPPQPSDEHCDECEAPMLVRHGRYGPFLACSRYPDCRGRKPLLVKTGVACPQCGGDLVEKRWRGKRPFYGCSNYPDCQFRVWSRPLVAPCPQCGGLLTSQGKDSARCGQCSWRGEMALAAQVQTKA